MKAPNQGFQYQGYAPQGYQQQVYQQQGYQQYQGQVIQGGYQQQQSLPVQGYQEVYQENNFYQQPPMKQQVHYQQTYQEVYQQPPQVQHYQQTYQEVYQQPPQGQQLYQQYQMPPQQFQPARVQKLPREMPPPVVKPRKPQGTSSKRPICFLDIAIGGKMAGRIVLELFSDITPKTCENFRAICTGEKGGNLSYKGCPFHRIIPQFMVQGGDFTNHDGTGGTSIYGGEFDDENFKVKFSGKYELAMANAGPNTNGSQFFITTTHCDWLSGKHVVFGKVIQGQDVVDAMDAVGTEDGKPQVSVVIVNCGQLQ